MTDSLPEEAKSIPKRILDWILRLSTKIGVVDVIPTAGTIIVVSEAVKDTAQECYLECLAAHCGESECSEAINSKYKLGNKKD